MEEQRKVEAKEKRWSNNNNNLLIRHGLKRKEESKWTQQETEADNPHQPLKEQSEQQTEATKPEHEDQDRLNVEIDVKME